MYLKKKWFAVLMIITTVLFLTACGGGDVKGSEETTKSDASKAEDATTEGEAGENEFTLISKGFEKYPVWFVANSELTRTSRIDEVLVFKDGDVTSYRGYETFTIEEMNELTDDEIVQHASEGATSIANGNYSLNIILDSYGQDTQEVELMIEDGTYVSKHLIQDIAGEAYHETPGIYEEYPSEEAYITAIRNGLHDEDVEIVGDDYIHTKEFNSKLETFIPWAIGQKIFDTTYAGSAIVTGNNDKGMYTRVDDSFFNFTTDSPDNKGENVTIEGK